MPCCIYLLQTVCFRLKRWYEIYDNKWMMYLFAEAIPREKCAWYTYTYSLLHVSYDFLFIFSSHSTLQFVYLYLGVCVCVHYTLCTMTLFTHLQRDVTRCMNNTWSKWFAINRFKCLSKWCWLKCAPFYYSTGNVCMYS